MKNYLLRIGILSFFIFGASCKFDKSSNQSFNNEISTVGEGLSVDEVFVKTDNEQLDDNTFFYGQKVLTNFENMDGFTIENGKYYPQMAVTVTDENDNVVMQNNYLFNTDEGLNKSLRTIYGELILANPFQSTKKYTVSYKITDTRGDGVFTSKMDFNVLPNPDIKVQESGITAAEVYIFNSDTRRVITNNEVKFNENLQFQFEGLKGYTVKEGFIALGLSITAKDASGYQIVHNTDAFENTLLTQAQVDQGVGGTLTLSRGILTNPVTWEVKIWDKNSEAIIAAKTEMEVK